MKKLLLVLLLLGTSPLLANMTCTLSANWPNGAPYSPYTVHITGLDADSIDIWASYGIYDTFNTFCVEESIHFSPNAPYKATIDSIIKSGGNYPQLQETTQKIYAAYLNGSFASGVENEIQKAIWLSQANEGLLDTSLVSSLDDLNISGWNNVMALNLWGGTVYGGQDIQSQLVRISTIPAPGALTLGGLGMMFVSWMRKRKAL